MKVKHSIFEKKIDKRTAVYVDYPSDLVPELKDYLISIGVNQLYSHQAKMFVDAQSGSNIVITTSTASGKTISFLLPVINEILINPSSRAFFIYPTKALANDQYRVIQPFIEYFGSNRISAGIYDGDTPPNERHKIKTSANIILTNPEMLNRAFLPHHGQRGFNFIFSNLKFIVIDELHYYRGVFGSHMANLFRRMSRICRYYNSKPQFFCSSATIANPVELAENICGHSFSIIDQDGSPASNRYYHFIQPPCYRNTEFPITINKIAASLIPDLTVSGHSFIAFCKSRKSVEILRKECSERLRSDDDTEYGFSSKISGYRGGYKPEERKEIERKMISGELKGLISTNALELGIDIGKVDTTVLIGYPGTRASFWQQSGRSGRGNSDSHTYLILDNLPFDQYIAISPEWLFETGSENAVIDKNNLFIQIAHARCAAAELPLSLDDIKVFPRLGEILPFLLKNGEVINNNGQYVWHGSNFPAGDFSLRNQNRIRYKVYNKNNNSEIAELDEIQAYREVHKGAIYLHDGCSYLVESLDTVNYKAEANPVDDDYFTEVWTHTNVKVKKTLETKEIGITECHFGDLEVSKEHDAFTKIQFHTHQNLGTEAIIPPLISTFETEGVWIDLPEKVSTVFMKLEGEKKDFGSKGWKTYTDSMAFTLKNSAMMKTMTTAGDIDASNGSTMIDDQMIISIYIYDLYRGGLGYSEKIFEYFHDVINQAIKLVSGCKCKDGCPACIGDYHLDKNIVLWGLKSVFEDLHVPENLKIPEEAIVEIIEKPYKFDSLIENWSDFQTFLKKNTGRFSQFLETIEEVERRDNKLILFVDTVFTREWILESSNKQKINNVLRQYIDLPENFDIDAECKKESSVYEELKISKRYKELLQ